VEKLKDLCLKQREEIKSLKSAVLFPDSMNSQINQMQELNQAREIIPNLQKQVISLNGQLQCIAQDLAEVILFLFLLSLICNLWDLESEYNGNQVVTLGKFYIA